MMTYSTNSTGRGMLRRLWRDQRGSVLSAELVMLITLLAIGVIVGAKSFRDAAVTEFADFAQAIANIDQTYSTVDDDDNVTGGFIDARDFCDFSDNMTPSTSTNPKLSDDDDGICDNPSNFAVQATPES